MENELWKVIPEFENYEISNFGRIKSLLKWDISKKKYIKRESILTPVDNGSGYLIIGLRKNCKRKNFYIHRLVADAFIENPKKLKYVNHIDYNKSNNNVSNLEWCTQKENVQHSICNMKHRKTISHTNTGEMYISKRKNRYRITIDRKEYRSCKTLNDAIIKRDMILKGEVMQ